MATPFTSEYLKFFKGLEKNNEREWFQGNKKTYEKEVKKPFEQLVQDMILRIREKDPEVQITPKESIFRINRDIRFSEDKSPYKTYMAANISRGGRKNMEYPGFYFQIGGKTVMLAGGAYNVSKEGLVKIRDHIASHLKEFQKLVDDKNFKDHFGTLQGDQHKRLPEEYKAIQEKQPLIANKQFYYYTEIPADEITKEGFTDKLMEYYMAGKPINDFLKDALK